MQKFRQAFTKQWPLHLMLLPCVILLLIFSYYPMVGIIVAFEKYNPRRSEERRALKTLCMFLKCRILIKLFSIRYTSHL